MKDNNSDHIYIADVPGSDRLYNEIAIQLLIDLRTYRNIDDDLIIDFTESCPEGKMVDYMDGYLENLSDVIIRRRKDDSPFGYGWMDFINKNDSYIIYWKYLYLYEYEKTVTIKFDKNIPIHILKRVNGQA